MVYKWRDGKLIECGRVESLFTVLASSAPGHWESFSAEHGDKAEDQQIEMILSINAKNLSDIAPQKVSA